jgi:GAF domain-containing protein
MLTLILTLVIVAALAIGGAYAWRVMQTGGSVFGQRPERRLGVIEQTTIDGRRRLILLRRDNVEHLIMTGGPVDVVIETGIGAPRQRVAAEVSEPVFARAARAIGQPAQANGANGAHATTNNE